MKLNKFLCCMAITLLLLTAMGFTTGHVFAQGPDTEEGVKGPDTDNQNEQIGEQNGPDTGTEADEVNDEGTDTQNDNEDVAPTGTAAITAEAAQKVAETYLGAGTASKVELDDENGQWVYSVAFGSTDVKVDATSGTVLHIETGQD